MGKLHIWMGCVLLAAIFTAPALSEEIDEGDQLIDGTSVHTKVYVDRGYAEFTNSCGTQQLTQSALQGGAKPRNIMPCPRQSSDAATGDDEFATPLDADAADLGQPGGPRGIYDTKKRKWAAAAAGFNSKQVGVGTGSDYDTVDEAKARAIQECQKAGEGIDCAPIMWWNAGCFYVTVSHNADTSRHHPVWGAGRTAQKAYDQCVRRLDGAGDCNRAALGGCYPDK